MKNIKIAKQTVLDLREVQDFFKRPQSSEEIFYNLCFCLIVPQITFKKAKTIVESLKEVDYYKNIIPIPELSPLLKAARFHHTKSTNLSRAKSHFPEILAIVRGNKTSWEKREQLVKEVRGMGYKATSHFLRNCGEEDLAIIDTHIFKFLEMDKQPLSRKRYLEIEKEFCKIARRRKLSPSILDMYVWREYSETPIDQYDY